MADCAPAFVRPFHVSFPHSFLFLFVLIAAAVAAAAAQAPAAAGVPIVVTGLLIAAFGGVLPGATIEALRGLRVLVV